MECDLPPTLENVVSYSDSFVQMLQLNESQRKVVKKATRQQSDVNIGENNIILDSQPQILEELCFIVQILVS